MPFPLPNYFVLGELFAQWKNQGAKYHHKETQHSMAIVSPGLILWVMPDHPQPWQDLDLWGILIFFKFHFFLKMFLNCFQKSTQVVADHNRTAL